MTNFYCSFKAGPTKKRLFVKQEQLHRVCSVGGMPETGHNSTGNWIHFLFPHRCVVCISTSFPAEGRDSLLDFQVKKEDFCSLMGFYITIYFCQSARWDTTCN
jgi:hypothetical protein